MSPRSLTPRYRRDKTAARDPAYVRLSGHKHYLGKFNSPESHEKYRRKIAEWLNGDEAPMPRPDAADHDSVSVEELLAVWWKHNHARYKAPPLSELGGKRPEGEAGRFFDVFHEMRQLFGGPQHKAIHFGPKALKRFARYLAGQSTEIDDRMIRRARSLSRKVVNGQVSKLKAVFRWAVEEELLPGEVFHRLSAVRGLGRGEARESEPTQPVADADVEAVLPFCSRHVAAMIQVQRLTGMRSAELVSMRRSRIDAAGPLWIYKLGVEHKTGHHGIERQIELGPRAQAILKEFPRRSLDPDEYIFSPADAEQERRAALERLRKTPSGQGNGRGSNRVDHPRRTAGKHYTPDSYRRAIQRACDLADLWAKGGRTIGNDQRLIERWHPHQLRHSLATEIRRRFGADAAQVVLGHTSLDVTQLYAKADQALAAKVAREIG